MATLIYNNEGLMGDFLGTIPVMETLALEDGGADVMIHGEASNYFSLIPEFYNIKRIYKQEKGYDKIHKIDCGAAFGIGNNSNLYMSQAHFRFLGMKVPDKPAKGDLNYDSQIPIGPVDYLLSPFSRCLPETDKWQKEKWQELVVRLKDKTFGVLGNYKFDDPMYINGPNVTNFYSLEMKNLCKLFKNCGTLISVVTGTSHLAFHLGVRNILLTNQEFSWGNNPDAVMIKQYVPKITVNQLIEKL